MEQIAERGASLVRQQLALRSRFRTPKYGHVVEAVRTQVKPLSSGDVGARIYLGGRASFLGPILEGGAVAHFLAPKGLRSRRTRGRRSVLAIHTAGGVLFRAFAHHPGTPAYRWRQTAQAALEPQVQGILERALGEALSR